MKFVLGVSELARAVTQKDNLDTPCVFMFLMFIPYRHLLQGVYLPTQCTDNTQLQSANSITDMTPSFRLHAASVQSLLLLLLLLVKGLTQN